MERSGNFAIASERYEMSYEKSILLSMILYAHSSCNKYVNNIRNRIHK